MKFNNRYLLLLIPMVLTIVIINYMSFDKKDTKLYDVKLRNIVDKNMFAMYLEKKQEDGTSTYVVDEGSTWPEEGYTFNKTMSGCIDGDGNKIEEEILTYDEETHIATVDTGITAYCYLYFDIKEAFVPDMYVSDEEKLSTGDGYLVYHDGEGTYAANEAGDKSYRFSGNNPNNYVCLDGNTSGDGECEDITKLYRVIGWFPEENDPSKYRMKIIKSEYITSAELEISSPGKASKDTSYTTEYTSRVESTDVDGFYWSGDSSIEWNNWRESTLNKTLNSESGKYLTSLSAYTNIIENTKWYIGGNTLNNITKQSSMKTAYDNELGANKLTTSSSQCTDNSTSKVPCTDALLYQTSKVGLMYATEYGYASAPKNWGTQLYSYDKKANRSENWLYNGVNEWTLSRPADITYAAFYVYSSGYVYDHAVSDVRLGVRPVLVLKSETTIKSGDGSKGSPWRINLQSS